MWIDKLTQFCDAVSTGNTGTRVIGSTVDLSVARDIGVGSELYLYVVVETEVTAASAGTYQIALTSGTDASLSNPVNHILSASYVTDTTGNSALPAGTVILNIELPMEGTVYKQFIGIREIVGTANTTGGKITAFLTPDPHKWKAYADAVN